MEEWLAKLGMEKTAGGEVVIVRREMKEEKRVAEKKRLGPKLEKVDFNRGKIGCGDDGRICDLRPTSPHLENVAKKHDFYWRRGGGKT